MFTHPSVVVKVNTKMINEHHKNNTLKLSEAAQQICFTKRNH